MPQFIYHLAWASDWESLQDDRIYAPASLLTEGFIHCTRERAMLPTVAGRFFEPPRAEDLLLLTLDTSRICAPIRDDEVGGGEVFPHIYGRLELSAVVRREPMRRTDRGWELPLGEGEPMHVREAKLRELGIGLPAPPAPVAAYVGFVQTGALVVTAGQLPTREGKVIYAGKVGADVPEADAKEAARLCCINALAQLKAALGDLDRIVRIVRLEGFVASASGFQNQPAVLNGASELLLEVFGEAGRHTRAAIGAAELPLNAAVELSIWAEVAAG